MKQAMQTDKIRKEISQNNSATNPIVLTLQTELANSFLMYLNYKHYHWQTYGPLFRDLHHLFDEFSAEVLESTDELAERIRMIGQNPIARLEEIMETGTVAPARKDENMQQMIAEANRNCILIIKEIRDGIDVSDELGDPGTADLLTKYVQVYEKQEWFLRQLLESKDGLTE
jgi:starvation-inducible DNA-binding protein